MDITDTQVRQVLEILREEIVPAEGCTEPIAIAYVSAYARKLLGRAPEHIRQAGEIIRQADAYLE